MLSNSRPVSLMSVCCKIFEDIVAKNTGQFLEKNDLLWPFQHGFRSGLSTETQLIETIHDFCITIDRCLCASRCYMHRFCEGF